jgi:hypothetical protein
MADTPDSAAGERPEEAAAGRRLWPGAAVRAAVLAGLVVLVWFAVRPGFVYYRVTPAFPVYRLGARFASDFFPHPGGPVDYAAAFLSQFFLWHWAGALITVSLAAGLAGALWAYLRGAFALSSRWLHLVPLVLVPLLSARYAHHVSILLATLLALAAAALWARFASPRKMLALPVFVLASVLVYYLGCGSVFLFAVLCALSELGKRRWLSAGICLAVAAGLPLVLGMLILRERPLYAWARLVPAYRLVLRREPDDPLARLVPVYRYAEPFAGALVAGLWLYVVAAAAWTVSAARPRANLSSRSVGIVPWLAICLLAAAVVPAATNRAYGRVLSLDYYAYNGRWDKVLSSAGRIRTRRNYSLIVDLTVNWALAHTGRLNDDLLAYHPTLQGLLCAPEAFLPPVGRPYEGPTPLSFMRLSDIYYDLGRINEAEHMAHEALEAQGDRPWLVERLAVINLAKKKGPAASRFIALLALDPVYRRRALELQALLADEEAAARDGEIARLRALRPVGPGRGERTVEGMLEELIERSPTNEMAVQYLMAYYLLAGDIEGVVARVGLLAGLQDGHVPRLCKEALAIYKELNGPQAGFSWDLVGEDTRKRMMAFGNAVRAAGGDARAALRQLMADYGDSYFLYYAATAGGGDA